MRFEWDAEKGEANVTEREFDFAFASLIFDGPTLEKQDRRKDYGEVRMGRRGRRGRHRPDRRIHGPKGRERRDDSPHHLGPKE
jgi:uncharacterized DUF497 family protein